MVAGYLSAYDLFLIFSYTGSNQNWVNPGEAKKPRSKRRASCQVQGEGGGEGESEDEGAAQPELPGRARTRTSTVQGLLTALSELWSLIRSREIGWQFLLLTLDSSSPSGKKSFFSSFITKTSNHLWDRGQLPKNGISLLYPLSLQAYHWVLLVIRSLNYIPYQGIAESCRARSAFHFFTRSTEGLSAEDQRHPISLLNSIPNLEHFSRNCHLPRLCFEFTFHISKSSLLHSNVP
ncbi:hypothetical protein VTL71DRAFT_728 [Oculimacula yallundae]|uniref:Ubiquitin-like protease family profile domain-containing protein n=1 Tax=Oculimacula yallundae TaxID=86028 RepID=A0ABR4D126_9HELO